MSQAAVLYSSFYKHDTLINISARVVRDVETSLYHSRVHSSNRPTGSVLDASECEAGRNNFPPMYCNRNSSQVELLFLGKYIIFSPFLPREGGQKLKQGKKLSDCFPQEATLLTLRNAKWVTSSSNDSYCSAARMSSTCMRERKGGS